MGRRLRCSSVTSRSIFVLAMGEIQVNRRTKMGRDAPSTASPARTALPAAHFERNDIAIICEMVHYHRSSGMLDNGKFERIVKLKPSEVMETLNFPFDPTSRS